MKDLRKEISIYRTTLQECLNAFQRSCIKCKIASDENCQKCNCKTLIENTKTALKQAMPFPDDKNVTKSLMREFQERFTALEKRVYAKVDRAELDVCLRAFKKEIKK